MPGTPTFIDDRLLRIGEVDFHCDVLVDDAPDGPLPVMKPRDLVERYIELSQGLQPAIIVELGIRRGGSTALLSELTHPKKLIAVDRTRAPAPALRDYVERRGLTEVVRPHYGVDQSDRARLTEILALELGRQPIDLIIDDASHLYDETLSSFETLFPRLRTGGLFVIEDWNADHLISDEMVATINDVTAPDHDAMEQRLQRTLEAEMEDDPAPRRIPLTQMVVELVVARSSLGDAINEVTINRNWVVVRRGADALDPETFRLADHLNDHFGFAAVKPPATGSGLE